MSASGRNICVVTQSKHWGGCEGIQYCEGRWFRAGRASEPNPVESGYRAFGYGFLLGIGVHGLQAGRGKPRGPGMGWVQRQDLRPCLQWWQVGGEQGPGVGLVMSGR